jgi:hypothetical protein
MFAVTRIASWYVPGNTLIVPPVVLMLQIAVWSLQYGFACVPVPVPAHGPTQTVV